MHLFRFVFLLFFTASIHAQDSLLIEKIKASSYSIQLENGILSGEGFDFLNKAGETCPFFLIGEPHGIADVSQFTAALFRAFKKDHGYRYFAAETGPFSAQFLQNTIRNKNGEVGLQTFFQQYPWSIPFFSFKEESEILEAIYDGVEHKEDLLWGLDQEFAASFRMHFKYLQENAENDQSREVAKTYFEKAMEAFQKSVVDKDPSKAFMSIIRPDDFTQLKMAFKGQSVNQELIREMEESIHIYQLWFQREGLASNRLRAELMKRHFWNYYSKASENEANPKVMIKLGANHIYRGANGLNVFDIGNFISELASQQGKTSFHLYIIGKKGTQNAYTPFSRSESDKQQLVDAYNYSDRINLDCLLKGSSDSKWSIIDLKPIRKAVFNRSLKVNDPGLEKIIWSYDAILMMPEVKAASYIK